MPYRFVLSVCQPGVFFPTLFRMHLPERCTVGMAPQSPQGTCVRTSRGRMTCRGESDAGDGGGVTVPRPLGLGLGVRQGGWLQRATWAWVFLFRLRWETARPTTHGWMTLMETPAWPSDGASLFSGPVASAVFKPKCGRGELQRASLSSRGLGEGTAGESSRKSGGGLPHVAPLQTPRQARLSGDALQLPVSGGSAPGRRPGPQPPGSLCRGSLSRAESHGEGCASAASRNRGPRCVSSGALGTAQPSQRLQANSSHVPWEGRSVMRLAWAPAHRDTLHSQHAAPSDF